VNIHDVDRFRLFTGTCGDDPRATLIVVDGNGLFGLTLDTVRMMHLVALVPDLLVVGIGYSEAESIADTVFLRQRDLTPTASEHFPGSGGADAFLDFIVGTVLPAHETGRSVFFGHSLGGLFGTHALLQERKSFDDYIISSPSLWWDHYAVFDREFTPASARVFFGIGADETDEGRRRETANLADGDPFKAANTYLDMVDDLESFVAKLHPHAEFDVAYEVVAGEFHATVPGAVLTRGLRFMFSN
jgi:predicted alpha/beta superfamily hydrolase